MSAINNEIKCVILYGTSKTTYIEVTGFEEINSISSFLITDVKNPNILDDSVSIDLELIALDKNGNVINERVIFDVVAP